jgi:hypothetical protein
MKRIFGFDPPKTLWAEKQNKTKVELRKTDRKKPSENGVIFRIISKGKRAKDFFQWVMVAGQAIPALQIE